MTNLWLSFWTQLRTAIASIWTDVAVSNNGGGIYRELMIEKVDWAGIADPFCVMLTPAPAQSAEDGGLHNRAYGVIVDITFVCVDKMRSGVTTVEHIESKLAAMEEGLYGYGFTDGVQVIQVMHYDVSPSNPVNDILLSLNQKKSGGTLRVAFEMGEEFE